MTLLFYTLDPVKTSMTERCRKAQKSDFFFDLGSTARSGTTHNSMQIEHTSPGIPGQYKAGWYMVAPEEPQPSFALSEVQPSFHTRFPLGFMWTLPMYRHFMKSARGCLNKTGVPRNR
jgi:hypothetical protein